jgi:hypothetical protein
MYTRGSLSLRVLERQLETTNWEALDDLLVGVTVFNLKHRISISGSSEGPPRGGLIAPGIALGSRPPRSHSGPAPEALIEGVPRHPPGVTVSDTAVTPVGRMLVGRMLAGGTRPALGGGRPPARGPGSRLRIVRARARSLISSPLPLPSAASEPVRVALPGREVLPVAADAPAALAGSVLPGPRRASFQAEEARASVGPNLKAAQA